MFKKLILLCALLVSANANFSKVASFEPELVQEGKEKHWCPVCGMSIKGFYKTSHAATLDDNGKKRQYCSVRCLVVDKEEYKIKNSNVLVTDANNEDLIPASKAFYVVGSKVPGTMAKKSKLAFVSKEEANEFIKEYGGKISNFDEVLTIATDSLENDIAMRNKKLNKKIYPMGKKLFEAKCDQSIDARDYLEINKLKAAIKDKKLCKKINPKQLQIISLYLWDVKRTKDMGMVSGVIKVDEKEKCPVCGMFVSKYPRWAAQLFYKDHGHVHHHSFDGVKDLMKFYFEPAKFGKYEHLKGNFTKIVVSDYYSQKSINAKTAYYVTYSDVYGPMGNELIPFAFLDDAKVFKEDHKGAKIIKFDEITLKEVYKLDE